MRLQARTFGLDMCKVAKIVILLKHLRLICNTKFRGVLKNLYKLDLCMGTWAFFGNETYCMGILRFLYANGNHDCVRMLFEK
jgi:hypothetical protein